PLSARMWDTTCQCAWQADTSWTQRPTRRMRGSPEVQAFQGRFQVVIDNMSVDHGRTQVRMPQGLLDKADIFRLAIEFRGKGMPLHVRGTTLGPSARFLPPPLHHGPQGRTIDRRALARRKEQAGQAGRAAGAPAPQLLQERFIEPEDAVFF